MNSTEEKIKVMQAFVDGKEIEFQQGQGEWAAMGSPMWDWHRYNYRIKPEPKTIWVNDYGADNLFAYGNREDAQKGASTSAIRIAAKYQEVEDD